MLLRLSKLDNERAGRVETLAQPERPLRKPFKYALL